MLVTRWAQRSCGDCCVFGVRALSDRERRCGVRLACSARGCMVWHACVDEQRFACGRVVTVLLPTCGACGWVCRLVAFLRHRGYRITVFISGFAVFLAPVKRCLFLAVLRGFLAF